MNSSARICASVGVLGLLLTVVNQLTSPLTDPALQRSSALAALASVGLMLVGVLWTRAVPLPPERAQLRGDEGLLLLNDLPEELRLELLWGSRQLLKATPAAVVLLWWNDQVVLQRGLLSEGSRQLRFVPGAICRQSQARQRRIVLVDLRHYPGRDEFEPLLEGLPSVLVQPLGQSGLLLLGGWSPRCFSSSDEAWVDGWASKLIDRWLASDGAVTLAAAGLIAPLNPDC
ncbi:MAG: cofactor assembly of complex C subunit B [Cyanobacteria bacterium K_DeepCast_35m_m2_023]|nr:cofactor assembly of complex C subunit B [Cyanobacteria bacterium K_DeepCast_35m_m2_023]